MNHSPGVRMDGILRAGSCSGSAALAQVYCVVINRTGGSQVSMLDKVVLCDKAVINDGYFHM